ncbi:hypothetical protein BDV38DRAFT_273207 [Aspergillus pseudotamarii]|uniref:Zn(2)-C6 fungal-type domain-containing protein n=1 Tax=Aspergillus pseudotamarii TaxID=132259 RepID=A0A5N6SNR0_ASPPS|nr:uncharacterized protein BDV38DRAFT_273207 [Aspergillus pseudotamarii]KAE8135003.1 hypothetical protein BDV38DRAFT_273207 [Aspergillus pseudotamarii]
MGLKDHLPALAPGPRGPVNKQPFTLMKPRKNSTACLPCKQAKRKCTGRPAPCKACQNTDAECVFDETLDLRRKVAARRTLGELEYYRGLLYSLLESLRSSDEDKVNHILETIRGSALLSNVANVVDAPADLGDASSDNAKPLGNADDAIAQQERLAADAHSRITLEKLCDIPIFQVPVKPWTAVTDDDHLVSHLISLYFTWDHPLSQIIDQRVFLRHMRESNKNTEFCTPFLVNSILAVASTYSDFPEVFAIPGDVASKGAHFFNEAELLWKAEEGRTSLTNIQALALMSHVQMSMECRKPVNLKPPIFEPPVRDNINDDIVWIPYPRSNHIEYEKKPALLREIMIQTVGFAELVVSMQDLLFDEAFDMNIGDLCRAVSALYTRLETWLRDLPGVLKIDKAALQVPQVLSLQYHHAIIQVFDSLVNHEDFAPMSLPDVNQARLIRLRSAKQIADYLLLYHEAYGLRHAPSQMLEPANASTRILLTALDNCEYDFKEEFVELCRFLVAFSKRFPLARDMLANIEFTAESMGIKLPPEAGTVFDHRNLESSQWL